MLLQALKIIEKKLRKKNSSYSLDVTFTLSHSPTQKRAESQHLTLNYRLKRRVVLSAKLANKQGGEKQIPYKIK
jgi:hypothetical protein